MMQQSGTHSQPRLIVIPFGEQFVTTHQTTNAITWRRDTMRTVLTHHPLRDGDTMMIVIPVAASILKEMVHAKNVWPLETLSELRISINGVLMEPQEHIVEGGNPTGATVIILSQDYIHSCTSVASALSHRIFWMTHSHYPYSIPPEYASKHDIVMYLLNNLDHYTRNDKPSFTRYTIVAIAGMYELSGLSLHHAVSSWFVGADNKIWQS